LRQAKLGVKETAGKKLHILILEDKPSDAKLLIGKLQELGRNTVCELVSTKEAFKEKARANIYDVICSDYGLHDWNGLDAFRWFRDLGHSTPFILVTGSLGDEQAVDCIRQGVTDYVLKSQIERLPIAVLRAYSEDRLRREKTQVEEAIRKSERQYRLLFESNPFIHSSNVFILL